MPESTVVSLMRSFKAAIARAGTQQQAAMTRRWLALERRLSGNIAALALEMTARQATGMPLTTTMLMNETRYRELLIQLQDELATYTTYAERTIESGQQAMASAGVRQASQAIAAQVSTSFNRLPVAAVEHMVGLTGAGTPLNSLLVQSWPLSAQGLTTALVEGVALGYNPRKVARNMAEGMTGTLNRMMTIARTEQLRVYRESSLASYKTSGIVTGYRRLCAHDRRTCAACIMDEGHVYDLDEEMPEHPNGRCAMIPVVAGAPPVEWLKGEEWFETQDAATQQDILGKGHYEGWTNGQFALQDLVKVKPNSTWGPSMGVTPLKELGGVTGRATSGPALPQIAPPARVVQPSGTQLSSVLNLPAKGPLAEPIRDAVTTIDQVHGDGQLQTLPVKTSATKTMAGSYSYNGKRQNDIKISTNGEHHRMTMAHEVGHWLDHQQLNVAWHPNRTQRYDSEGAKELWSALNDSSSVKRLRELRAGPSKIEVDGKTVYLDRTYLRVISADAEIWARAYAQYIATRSGNPIMRQELATILKSVYPNHWTDDDFAPIASAIDKIMIEKGWRQ